MRKKFKSRSLTYLFYKKEQNIWRKKYYELFPNKHTNAYKRIHHVLFELSSKCNLRCPFCTNRFRESGVHMPYRKAVEYFDKLPRTIKTMHLHFSGESFLNPEISQITKFLSDNGVSLTASTNGTLPANRYIETLKSGLDQLIFSIDGASPETHEKYRIGSQFNRIMETLSMVSEQKPIRTKVGVQFLVTKYNENEIGKMRDLLKNLDIDFFNLKTLSLDIASHEKLEGEKLKNAQEFLPRNEKYSRYRYENNHLKLKYPIVVCPFIYQPVIGADGEVSLCCIDIAKQIKIGNLNDYLSFEELWKTQEYRLTRKKVLNKKVSICKTCNYCLIGLKQVKLY